MRWPRYEREHDDPRRRRAAPTRRRAPRTSSAVSPRSSACMRTRSGWCPLHDVYAGSADELVEPHRLEVHRARGREDQRAARATSAAWSFGRVPSIAVAQVDDRAALRVGAAPCRRCRRGRRCRGRSPRRPTSPCACRGRLTTRAMNGVRSPFGGRNHAGHAPISRCERQLRALELRVARVEPAPVVVVVRVVGDEVAVPATSVRTTCGCVSSAWPTMKNVACTCAASRIFMICGCRVASGSSSKVIATSPLLRGPCVTPPPNHWADTVLAPKYAVMPNVDDRRARCPSASVRSAVRAGEAERGRSATRPRRRSRRARRRRAAASRACRRPRATTSTAARRPSTNGCGPADRGRGEGGAGGEHRDERRRAPDVGSLRDEPRRDARERPARAEPSWTAAAPTAHEHAPRPSAASIASSELAERRSCRGRARWRAGPRAPSTPRGGRRRRRPNGVVLGARLAPPDARRRRPGSRRGRSPRRAAACATATPAPARRGRCARGSRAATSRPRPRPSRCTCSPCRSRARARASRAGRCGSPTRRRAGGCRPSTLAHSAQHEVAELLVRTVVREVAPGEHRVEALGDRDLDQLVEHGEVVLAVGVDGEHEVVRRELAASEPARAASSARGCTPPTCPG